ncbi:MAG TPA: WhiB family transcriptional regulator [Actinopolymorphaceae bacterium]|jgi:WhiB family redox-sensing transcriptional regulator
MPKERRGRIRLRSGPAPSLEWQDRAACRDCPTDLFFGHDTETASDRIKRERRALKICMSCPVRRECRRHAAQMPEAYGIWGGTTEAARSSRQRRRRRLVTPAA